MAALNHTSLFGLAAVTLFCHTAEAGSLRLVRTELLTMPAVDSAAVGDDKLPILSMRFSPDGRTLAVIAGVAPNGLEGHSRSNVFLVDAVGSSKPVRVPVTSLVNEGESGLPDNAFQWSSDGTALRVEGMLIHLPQLGVCQIPRLSGFAADAQIIAQDPDFKPWENPERSRFVFFDSNCVRTGVWDVSESWFLLDTSPEQGLMLVKRESWRPTSPLNQTLVVNTRTREIIGRWPTDAVFASRFAASGGAICGGRLASGSERVPVMCWDTMTGKPLGTAPTANGGRPLATSAASSIVIVSDYHRTRIPFSTEFKETLAGRVVWDFKTGKEVVSWKPASQTYIDPRAKISERRKDPFRFTISPDGHFVVEGGNGRIHFYRIEP